jgi:hypothetical protein
MWAVFLTSGALECSCRLGFNSTHIYVLVLQKHSFVGIHTDWGFLAGLRARGIIRIEACLALG